MTTEDWSVAFRRRAWFIGAATAAAIVLIGFGLVGATLRAQTNRDVAAQAETHTLRVLVETHRLMLLIVDAETGQRGFLLTRDEEYLGPYREAIKVIPGQLDRVTALTSDNPVQQRHMGELHRLISDRLNRLAAVVEMQRRGDAAAAADLVRQGRGKVQMDAIRREIDGMVVEETRLLRARAAEADRAADDAWLAICALVGLGVFILIASGVAVGAAARARRAAMESANRAAVAEQVQSQLAARVEQATSELRATEAQLRQSQKMEAVGKLTGGIAHDFNNMLAIVIGSLDMIERRLARGQTDIKRFVDNAMEGAKRAAILTQRLLAFSRQQPLEPQVLDANQLVSGMSELLRRTLGETVMLESVLAGGLWRTQVDPHQLESAVLNLAVNARDAMPDGGKLTIETGNAHLDDAYAADHAEVVAGQYVVVAVTDTGAGMPPEVVANAFDPFFSTKPVGKGTGLGLSQVYGFVKQSGGHVKIYSEVGHGTTVKIYLPRHHGVEAKVGVAQSASAPLPDGRITDIILVVEDEARVRRMSVDALRDLGYTVHHAGGGAEALKMLETVPGVKLLFTDIVMPDMNGRQLAEEAQAKLPGLKVLYTTGYTRNAVVHGGTIDPGVAFLPKPFTIAQLAAKVRQVLDERA